MVTGAGGEECWGDSVGEIEAAASHRTLPSRRHFSRSGPGPASGFLLGGAPLETAGTEVPSACRAGHLSLFLAVFGALRDTGWEISAVGGLSRGGRL